MSSRRGCWSINGLRKKVDPVRQKPRQRPEAEPRSLPPRMRGGEAVVGANTLHTPIAPQFAKRYIVLKSWWQKLNFSKLTNVNLISANNQSYTHILLLQSISFNS